MNSTIHLTHTTDELPCFKGNWVLVGSAPSILDSSNREIDLFENVVRFNRAPTISPDTTGVRTTLRVLNSHTALCRWPQWLGTRPPDIDQNFSKTVSTPVIVSAPLNLRTMVHVRMEKCKHFSFHHPDRKSWVNALLNEMCPWRTWGFFDEHPRMGFTTAVQLAAEGKYPVLYGFSPDTSNEKYFWTGLEPTHTTHVLEWEWLEELHENQILDLRD